MEGVVIKREYECDSDIKFHGGVNSTEKGKLLRLLAHVSCSSGQEFILSSDISHNYPLRNA